MDIAFIKLKLMSKMGFTLRNWGMITLGQWADLFEEYKKQYNFEMNRGIYQSSEEPKIASLDEI